MYYLLYITFSNKFDSKFDFISVRMKFYIYLQM